MTMLNPALAALLKTAQMATPQGTPTVAQGIAKLALQQEMPQAAPPALPEVTENVQAALPTMERNAQQAQMEQIANMVAQRMSPENSGIAQLPAGGGEYAEGGVVGFSGTGEFGSVVPDVEAEALDTLRVEEARRKRELAEKRQKAEFLAAAGAPQAADYAQYLPPPAPPPAAEKPKAAEPPFTVTPDPQQQQLAAVQKLLVALMGAGSGRVAAPAAAAGAPATGEDPLADLTKAANRGEYPEKPRTMQEQVALLNEARRARGLTGNVGEGLEKLVQDLRAELARLGTEREKSLKGRPLENLIQSFAAARTGGLGGLGRTYANLQSAQRAEQERFNALQYERKMTLAKIDADKESMREAAARGDMEAYDKYAQNLATNKRHYDDTTATLQAALGRGKVDVYQTRSREREGAENRAAADRRNAEANRIRAALGIARLLQPGKAAPGMSVPDQLKLKEHVNAVFPSKGMPTPEALTYLAKVDNGAQLIRDIANGNIKPDSPQWNASVVPALIKARELYTREFLAQTKHGAPAAVPYSQALADAED